MSRTRRVAEYVLIALGVVATAMLGWVAGILKPKHLPHVAGYDIGGLVEAHPLGTFVLLLAAAVLVAVLTEVFGRKKQDSQENSVEFTLQLRTELLEVLSTQYEKRLRDPREQEVWLELELEEIPWALAPNPNFRLVGNRESHPLERGTPIEHIFDEAGGRLLILGEPGSGKTTMLLQLAQSLIYRAEEEDTEPVPVVVNLASWAQHGGTIREWLIDDALQNQANVGQEDLARTLVEGNRLLLLLDGLDEVEAEKRERCIAAINNYLREEPHRAVVCSRTEEYERSSEQLALEKAVRIEPLEPGRVIRELELRPGTHGLRTMLHEDEHLRELATTPLNVSVMLLAYGGEPASEVYTATTAERREVLWDDYVTRMIARRPTEYAPKNILSWLSWLAKKMQQDNITRFIPDRMQPTWLKRSYRFKWTIPLVFALLSGLCIGLVSGLGSGIAASLCLSPIFGLTIDTESIQLEEKMRWDWSQLAGNWKDSLTSFLPEILSIPLILGLIGGLGNRSGELVFGVLVGLAFGMAIVLVITIVESLSNTSVASMVEKGQSLGQRLRKSRKNGFHKGLVIWLIVGPVVGLSVGLIFGLYAGLTLGLVLGVFFALYSGLVDGGGGEALKFDILRFYLWRRGVIPWHYFHFLRETADLLLLEQDGGAVEFRHLLLRDYFAELTPERINNLTSRIESRSS